MSLANHYFTFFIACRKSGNECRQTSSNPADIPQNTNYPLEGSDGIVKGTITISEPIQRYNYQTDPGRAVYYGVAEGDIFEHDGTEVKIAQDIKDDFLIEKWMSTLFNEQTNWLIWAIVPLTQDGLFVSDFNGGVDGHGTL